VLVVVGAVMMVRVVVADALTLVTKRLSEGVLRLQAMLAMEAMEAMEATGQQNA
jgi:hypothetical protein